MNEILIKSFDILKEEQRNADNKAYIFIGLITVVVGVFAKIPSTSYSPAELSGSLMFLFALLLPLLILIISLIPRYNMKLYLSTKSSNHKELNIFHWKTIIQNKSKDELMVKFNEKYEQKLDDLNSDLICQIYDNAKIMSTKATLHELAFMLLIHILIFLFSSLMTVVFFSSNLILFFVVYVAIELLYYLVSYFKNKK